MKKTLYIIVAMLLCMLMAVSAASMTRSVPTQTSASTFTVTYTASGVSGLWGASVQDSVTGGCKFPNGGTTYRSVMISDDGASKSVTMTVPSGTTSCSFSGDYKFGEDAVVSFASSSITITDIIQPGCTYSDWSTCSSSCTQTRTVTSGTGCTGTLSQTCSGGSCTTQPPTVDFCSGIPWVCDNIQIIVIAGIGIILLGFLK